MEIIVEKNSGFCFGVKNAVEKTIKELEEANDKNIYTYGTLIHNRQVINKLLQLGLREIDDIDALKELEDKNTTFIIRSHGVSRAVLNKIKEKEINYIDCTCPFVSKIHKIVRQNYNEGCKIFIAGNPIHPEVIGINGWCNNEAVIIENEKTVDNLPLYDRICLVAQTTITSDLWDAISKKVNDKYKTVNIFNTRCSATENRQKEAKSLAKEVDLMLVIGGRNSSNTGKLFEICKEECNNTYHIETSDELTKEMFIDIKKAGITAGASTPDWILKEVINKMQDFDNEKVKENTNEDLNENVNPDTDEIINVNEDTETTEDKAENEISGEAVELEANEPPDEMASVETTKTASEIADDAADKEENPVSGIIEDDAAKVEPTGVEPTEVETEPTRENLMEEYEKSFVRLSEGDTVKGIVLSLNDDEVIVNIGYKADGIISRAELTHDTDVKPSEIVNVGDEIEVKVVRINDGEGNVVLSKKMVELDKNFITLEAVHKNNLSIKGIVKDIVKGGGIVELLGVKAFMPASLFDLFFINDLESFRGQEVTVKIIELIKENKKIILSRKAHLLEEREKLQQKFWDSVDVGKRIVGEVKRLTDFGAFVDIGGLDGLIHISELSWVRINHPSEVLSPGEKVEVVVLSFDQDKNKVSLGLKQTMPEPWDAIIGKYNIGDIIEVKIVRFANFGAFAEIEPGVDGLIHISQIADERIAKPSQVLEIGEIVKVKIIDANIPDKKMSLSIIEAQTEEAEVPVEAEETVTEIPEEAEETVTENIVAAEAEEVAEEPEEAEEEDAEEEDAEEEEVPVEAEEIEEIIESVEPEKTETEE